MHTHRRISTQRLLHENTLTHRRFYTQTLLHTYAFTCRCLFTDAHTLSHTNAFTHRRFCTQTLFHTDPFTHRRFYTQTLLHTYACTHGRFYTQTLLHTDAFTHRRFYTQTLLHTDAFPHRPFYTQTLLHTNTFTHRRFHRDFYTETLTKRGTTGWPQLQTKVRKHSCNGNAKKSRKCTRPGSVPWSTHNPMQGIRSLRYKISSAPWCRGWPQLQTQVGKHRKCYKMQKYTNKGSVPWYPKESRTPCKNAVNDSTIASSISWWQGWHLFHCISPMFLQDGKKIFTDKQQLATGFACSSRTVSPDEQCYRLICARASKKSSAQLQIQMVVSASFQWHIFFKTTGQPAFTR